MKIRQPTANLEPNNLSSYNPANEDDSPDGKTRGEDLEYYAYVVDSVKEVRFDTESIP